MHHAGPIAGVAANAEFVATAGYDNTIILWKAKDHSPVARANHDHLVNQCAFSNDGKFLVSASSDYSARLWEVPSLRLLSVLAGHKDDVDMAAFSPNDSLIATCALDRCVRIFNTKGNCLHEMIGHKGNVLSLAWSSDSRHVVTSSVDGTIRKWDAILGIPVEITSLDVRTDSVELDTNGAIYAGDDRGRIAVIAGGHTHFLQAHRAGIKKIVLDNRSRTLISLSYDRSIAIWRIAGPLQLVEVRRSTLPKDIWARAAALMQDGRIAVGTFGTSYAVYDPTLDKWDMTRVSAGPAINAVLNHKGKIFSVGDEGKVMADASPIANMGSLCNFLVSCGERIFAGGQMGRLFDAQTGEVLFEHHSPLNCAVAFDINGRPHFAVGTYTGQILVFCIDQNGAVSLSQQLAVYENAVKGLSQEGGILFSVCANTHIAWHSVDSWALIRYIENAHERIVNACCSLGGQQFASVSRDRTLRIWGPQGQEMHESPHPNSIKCVAANEARTHLLSGSYGGTLALFDTVKKSWSEITRPTTSGISAITWSTSEQCFVAASYDGNLYSVTP